MKFNYFGSAAIMCPFLLTGCLSSNTQIIEPPSSLIASSSSQSLNSTSSSSIDNVLSIDSDLQWLTSNYQKGRFAINYPSKAYNLSKEEWVPLHIDERDNGIKISFPPPSKNGWKIFSVENIQENKLDTWVKNTFGESCIFETQISSLPDSLDLRIKESDPNKTIMSHGPLCRGGYMAIRVIYNKNRQQIVWWELGQEPTYYKSNGDYFDSEMGKSFHFVDEH